MEKMFLKRNPLVFLFFLFFCLLAAGFLTYSFLLPRYVEKKFLPYVGRQLSSTIAGQVYSIGFSAADFGEIVLGDMLNPAVTIGSIHADYSLPSLLAKNLGHIKVNGLSLSVDVTDGRITLPGVVLENLASSQAESAGPQQSAQMNVAVTMESFQISNGLVKINYNGHRLLLPFHLQLTNKPEGGRESVYSIHLQMMPLGEEITLEGTIDLSGNRSVLTLTAESLDLHKLLVLSDKDGFGFNLGKTSISGQAEIDLLPLQLVTLSLNIDPDLLHFGNIPIRFGQGSHGTGHAIHLKVSSNEEKLLVNAQGSVHEPLAVSLEINGSVVQEQNDLTGAGNIVIRIAESMNAEKSDQRVLLLESGSELQADFIFARNKSGDWKGELKSPLQKQHEGQSQQLHVHFDTISLQSGIPTFTILGQGTADSAELHASLALPNVELHQEGTEITVSTADLQATYNRVGEPDQGGTSSSTFRVNLDSTKLKKNTLRSKADILLQGKMAPQLINGMKVMQTEGKITLNDAAIIEDASSVALTGLEGRIPWTWPQSGKELTGEIKASRIRWQDIDLGTFRADITLKDMTYFLDGNYKSSLIAGFAPKFSARAGFADSVYSGEIVLHSDTVPFAPVNLGIFDPALNNSYISGALDMDVSLKFEAAIMQGSMQLGLRNGTFEFPDKKYNIKGMDFNMRIPSLPDMRTAPAQTLQFAEASIGNLSFRNGKFIWQLESLDSVFLEEGVLQWAGGRVFANAVRISSEKKEIVVPIFCDRLRLTELLHQFGITDAEGEGTVSGRLPLLVGKKAVGFEDGFLYSSPGQGGSVKVSAFELLAAGIPKNTPQFAQVDFAAEALKNFQYNWVKLVLNTEGEDLLMQMQMDGKPVQSLPFKYDSQTGLLQRIEKTEQGIMQPIRLDVNFRLPLNRFLGYSGKIQDLMKKIR